MKKIFLFIALVAGTVGAFAAPQHRHYRHHPRPYHRYQPRSRGSVEVILPAPPGRPPLPPRPPRHGGRLPAPPLPPHLGNLPAPPRPPMPPHP